jgi:outer membrane protein OmpA-like peptidoglycan-associated protein/tetratricopeptide (TPR) repeat protein
MRWIICFVVICFALPSASYSQVRKKQKGSSYSKTSKKIEMQLLNKARKNMRYVSFEQDIQDYTELLKIDSINPQYNFGMAIVLYTNFYQPKSIPYFERAFRHSTDTIGDAYYFLASSYHLAGNYKEAEKNYKTYLRLLTRHGTELVKKEETFLKEDVERRIEMCVNGIELDSPSKERKQLINNGKGMVIKDIGKGVNSSFDDYDALFTGTDSMVFFTTRREGTTGSRVDYDDKYYEDICTSKLTEKGWSECEKLNHPVNTKKHEAIVQVSKDGNRIYFYKGVNQGTFFYSDRKGNSWSKPKILLQKADINSKDWETSFYGFAITVADDEMFVVSDREGGMGGRDIYVSKRLPNKSWGELENLGPVINTKYDEDSPYLTPDGNTMYFSSSGHNSMGGFDIFRSMRVNGKWTEPQNLGTPLNTPGDDIYLTFLHQSDKACYSSSGYAADSSRDMDIYTIEFCDDPAENVIKGYAKGVSSATITVTEKDSAKEIGNFLVENEHYAIKLPLGKKYLFKFVTPEINPAVAEISVPSECKLHDIYQELIFTKVGDSLSYKNAFFDVAKYTLNAGDSSYHQFLSKADMKKFPDYSEVKVITAPKSTIDTMHAIVSTVKDSVKHTTETTFSFINILFDFDKSIVKDMYKPDLKKMADYLIKTSPRDNIEIDGHADSKGPDQYNLALSHRRANAVAVDFVSNGVVKKRMKVVGFGESRPAAPNENPDGSDNPEGRAKNRRVEVIILSTDIGAVIDDYFEGKGTYGLKEIKEMIDPSLKGDKNANIIQGNGKQEVPAKKK